MEIEGYENVKKSKKTNALIPTIPLSLYSQYK
jgi:hypothetical protein